ncbi:MAG TPA: hypothetical protein VL485_32915 [Ktedonobacteraceae bacterium]|jgi:hypothetical protein|nr:hypothetical protein [Ktedonobacteraceae bacterium]
MGQQQPEPPRIVEPPVPLRPFVAYMIGLALGSISAVLIVLAVGGLASQISGTLMTLGLMIYLLSIIGAIVCLLVARTRFIGYGLLTMVFVAPVVWYIACVVIYTGR